MTSLVDNKALIPNWTSERGFLVKSTFPTDEFLVIPASPFRVEDDFG